MLVQVQKQLIETLKKIDRPGTFCTSGRLPPTLPGLEVAGIGPVALPLVKHQAAAIGKQARQAPYGKGARTLVDTNVRRVWEIDADQVVLANSEWPDVLKQAVHAVQAELGLEKQNIEAHLYKLLLYERGSFFLPHRDGEKFDRMVATLVIALPSAHQGGELVVRHEGREKIVDFSPQSQFQTQFAAFYADCEHEIRLVSSGFRLALVYNLTLTKSKQAISAPTSSEHIAAFARVLEQWKAGNGKSTSLVDFGKDRPATKLAVLLDHQYSQAGLAYDALKGVDRAKADGLFAAARQTGCDASLTLVTKWVSGSAEPSGSYGYGYSRSRRRGRYRYDDGNDDGGDDGAGSEHEMGEVFDQSLTAEHFSDAEGNRLAFGRIPLNDDEIVSATSLGEGKPNREDFEGYTGNAGMTLERWYHRAAILLWPADDRFDVLCEAGVKAAIGGLEQMVRRWKQGTKGEQAEFKQPCLEFARQIIAHWPQRKFVSGAWHDFGGEYDFDVEADEDEDYDDEDRVGLYSEVGGPGSLAPHKPVECLLLSLLEELEDASLITAWLRGVLAKDVSLDPGKTLGDLCQQYGWMMFHDELHELFESTSNETLERHARLLADWSLRKGKNADRNRLCSELASQFMSAMERCNHRQAKRDWRARTVNRREQLPPLVQTFLVLEEPKLLERLVTHVLGRPKEFGLTAVQVPALLSLESWLKRHVHRASPPLYHWLTAVQEELESRAAHPPREHLDWRRESATGCHCADCKELCRFLQDRDTKTLRLPLAENRRRHLHQIIDGKKLDTTHVTERRGRPYTLVCTKTKASYERALKAHHLDLDQLAKLRKLMDWYSGLNAATTRPGNHVSKSKGTRRK